MKIKQYDNAPQKTPASASKPSQPHLGQYGVAPQKAPSSAGKPVQQNRGKHAEAELRRRRDDVQDFFSRRRTVSPQTKEARPGRNFRELDFVRILRDVPETDLKKGMQGTIIELIGNPPIFAEVEVQAPHCLGEASVIDIEFLEEN